MKIVSRATIKECKIKAECADLKFEGLQLTGEQYRQVSELIEGAERVEVTIQPVQGRLPGEDEDAA